MHILRLEPLAVLGSERFVIRQWALGQDVQRRVSHYDAQRVFTGMQELPDIQLVQNFHRIPMNTTYWKNWPTAQNPYVNGASWHLTYPIVLWSLQPA